MKKKREPKFGLVFGFPNSFVTGGIFANSFKRSRDLLSVVNQ